MSPPAPLRHYLLVLLSVNGLLWGILALIRANAFPDLFDADSFLFADANHYRVIQASGYRGVNIAFFPLAPFTWRLLGLGVYGILALHSVIYGSFALWLARELRFSLAAFAFSCALPSVVFLVFPYSEAMFFAGSTLVLLGLHKDRYPLLLAGLLLCTLTRPAFTVFFPALLITEWLRGPLDRKALLRILGYAGTFAIGVTVVAWVQWLDTGEWFRFFGVQKAWGNFLQVPRLPLQSWGGREALLLDAGALVVGLVAMGWVVLRLARRLRRRLAEVSPAVAFSFCYLAGITLLVLAFRGGFLFSLNRFVFATPFAFVALNYSWKESKLSISPLQTGLLFLSLEGFFLLFESYLHLETFLCFSVVALYFTGLAATRLPGKLASGIAMVLAFGIQFGYLAFASWHLLTGHWIA